MSDKIRPMSVSKHYESFITGTFILIFWVRTIVTKFLGRWGRGTGSRYVVLYLREILDFGSKMNP